MLLFAPTWVSSIHPLLIAHVRRIIKILIIWCMIAFLTWVKTIKLIRMKCVKRYFRETFLSLQQCIADVWGLWIRWYVGQVSEAAGSVYFLLRWKWESITGAAAAAQTPMTVYYRQFQTTYAHGLNIANGDSRQVPYCFCVRAHPW